MKIQLLILLGALLLAPARANLIPDDFPWNPINVDYNGETCLYDYQPQELETQTTLRLGGDGYSSVDSLIKSVKRNNLPTPIKIQVGNGTYVNKWNNAIDFDVVITCPNKNCIFKSDIRHQPRIRATNVILKDITFIGGKYGLIFQSNYNNGRKDIVGCMFCKSKLGDGLSIRDSGDFYVYRSEASYNMQDSFDYHAEKKSSNLTRIIELDVTCKETGYIRASSNCSTAHDDVQIIRVNGFYDRAKDRTIDDVHQSQTLIINSFVGAPRRKASVNHAMNFSNAYAYVIMKDVEQQDIVGEVTREEIK